jgi:hypothetical protein
MTMNSIKTIATASGAELFVGDKWFDPSEAGVRSRIRGFIEELLEAELDERQLTGTGFGLNKIAILAAFRES